MARHCRVAQVVGSVDGVPAGTPMSLPASVAVGWSWALAELLAAVCSWPPGSPPDPDGGGWLTELAAHRAGGFR